MNKRRMNQVKRVLLGLSLTLLTVTLLTSAPLVASALTNTVAVQGAIAATGGGPAPDGSYSVTFALYDGKAAKTSIWTEGVTVSVVGGRFAHSLGAATPIPWNKVTAAKAVWLGVKVGVGDELSRTAVQSVFFARKAGVSAGLDCAGCVEAKHLAAASIKPTHAGFPYAGSSTKGGPADKALGLECTGCVTTKHLKFDADLDLAGHGLKAGKITADSVVAKSVAATKFIGDGSGLTGIKTASGKCPAGQAMTGIDANGKPLCAAIAPKLAADLLDDVSNGALSNEFLEVVSGNKNIPIKDNDPTGKADVLAFPDIGNAKTITVKVHATNSDVSKLKLTVFDPSNQPHVLFDGPKTGAKGTSVKGAWPKPDKLISGDLNTWIGKNPKGSWRLSIIDTGFLDNKVDGEVVSWSIEVGIVAASKVAANGMLLTNGGLRFQRSAKHPHACTPKLKAYIYYNTGNDSLYVCNGKAWFEMGVAAPLGSENRPATSCKAIVVEGVATKSGNYWLDMDGTGPSAKVQTYCDLTFDNGGWTQFMACRPGDNCTVSNKFIYGENWLGADFGVLSDTKSYNLGKSLAKAINLATEVMIIVESGEKDRGWIRFALNNDTRRWLQSAGYYQSGTVSVKLSDTYGVNINGATLRICWAPTNSNYAVRSFKGAAGMKFLNRSSATPNNSANSACDYGPWGAQMLIRAKTGGKTATWGTSNVSDWSKQKYTHRILVR